MILTVTLNPSVDQTLYVRSLVPGDTNRVQQCETDAGGKGANLSRVAVELGATSVATGFLGGSTGRLVRTVLEAEGVTVDCTPIKGVTRTNINVESLEGGPPTTLNSKGPEISPKEWENLLERINAQLSSASWLALCGSQPPGVPMDAYHTIGLMARSAGVKLLVDADGDPMLAGFQAGPDLIKPNSKEASRLVGYPTDSEEDAARAAVDLRNRLLEKSVDPVVVVSRGKAGAVMACATGSFLGRSPQIEARSSVGSGDSMLAGILAARERGDSWPDSLRLGLAAGAATATTNGAEIGRRDVILALTGHAQVTQI